MYSRLHNCIYAINGKTKGQNYTNFESNLAMMVMYLPVKFEFDWTKHFRIRVRKHWRTNRQTNRRNYTNFKRNLAMMVIYLPVMFEFDWTQHFWVKVRKQKCWWTDKSTKKRTYKLTELHQFWKESRYDGDLSPCQVWIQLDNRFQIRVRKRKFWRTDGQKTDKWMDGITPI